MTDDLMPDIEDVIREVVSGRTVMGAASLAELLNEIDYRLRVVPSPAILDVAIGHLNDKGVIGLIAGAGYVDGRSAGVARAPDLPSGQGGVAGRVSWRATEVEGPRPSTPVLVAAIPIAGEVATRDEWQRAESVAMVMTDALRIQRRSTTVPWIRERPRRLEFELFATANDDPRRLHRMVTAIFESAAPAGSELNPIPLPLP